jgi:hypothetical protein
LCSDALLGDAVIVNFVLFGLGRAGTIHANNLLRHPLAKILYIVELDTAKALSFVETHEKLRGSCKVLHPDRKNEALADSNIHAAMCASTTSTHEVNEKMTGIVLTTNRESFVLALNTKRFFFFVFFSCD